ncbi:hypothetical protein [Thalassolituus sp.]|uniref:hypothetical protein n=1 Tax=Thalassolituus sp. TaxID=2030822 RepID=UPI00261E4BC6|nr:hypothetical protein [Thalassolituus sp.]
MDTRTIQEMADDFNVEYHRASNTSDPHDWLQVALVARQMIDAMAERGIISDSLPALQKQSA